MHTGNYEMVATKSQLGPMVSDEDERSALADADTLLRERHGAVFLADEQGNRVELPDTAVRLIHQVVLALARGNPVEVTALPKMLTIRHAAEMLDLRPQDLVRLLDQGKIPFVQDSDVRRIRFQDVMAYKPTRDADRRAAMEELVRLSEEMGLYELDAASEQPPLISRHVPTAKRGDSSAAS